MRTATLVSLTTGIALASTIAALPQEPRPPNVLEARIYGQLHASIDSLDDGSKRDLYLSSNSSRLGFKGPHQ